MEKLILNFCLYLFFVLVLSSCKSSVKVDSAQLPTDASLVVLSDFEQDSIQVIKLLDALPKVELPYLSQFYNPPAEEKVSLAGFRSKQLANLSFQNIERSTETGCIDCNAADSIFDLIGADSLANLRLLAKRPNFLLLEVFDDYSYFVTFTYDFRKLDAIRSAYSDPGGNQHWHAYRQTTLQADLKLVLEHCSELETEEGKFEKKCDTENWFIDDHGRFLTKK